MQQTWKRIKWIGGYARQHIWAIAVYTLLGLAGTGISLLGSLVSKDLIDIITGHETGQVVMTFCIMIGMNLGSVFLTQISNYISTKISMSVDAGIKADIFSKILVTDWESLTEYRGFADPLERGCFQYRLRHSEFCSQFNHISFPVWKRPVDGALL